MNFRHNNLSDTGLETLNNPFYTQMHLTRSPVDLLFYEICKGHFCRHSNEKTFRREDVSFSIHFLYNVNRRIHRIYHSSLWNIFFQNYKFIRQLQATIQSRKPKASCTLNRHTHLQKSPKVLNPCLISVFVKELLPQDGSTGSTGYKLCTSAQSKKE